MRGNDCKLREEPPDLPVGVGMGFAHEFIADHADVEFVALLPLSVAPKNKIEKDREKQPTELSVRWAVESAKDY